MIKKLTAKEFAELNDIKVNDIKEFGSAREGAEGLRQETELTIYTNEDAWGGYSLIITRNDNRWGDSIEVICGNIDDWTI